ncbi:translation initiation factor IF-2 [Streptomyces sp. NBC_00569]|uniref:WXG100 family type VII secretion target n=1 Tax=unclassified Streptomyces TaxID=2593676 RepID=UPI0022546ECE|nr:MULTISPECIES: translation initiation factor IF-2 [unclassified Streptomyces]MCX5437646.1 translation initiation factor IF-2 [Streptomyces sp. NBC_00063]WUB95757.1 translation initiation factor IF-2 [Streptomyces sp. NBC_00569]
MAEAPIDGGSVGGTQFASMSHEQMLAWLDQANSGDVQDAAGRLTAAAKEIHKIADELKVRPQWVKWKGEGADSFRSWAGDLANATLGLGDYSEGAAKWMGEAANAISTAQATIPRDKHSAQANLDAAHAAHNDPDAQSVASKSSSELAAIAADKEKVRLEAAGHMEKLGQAFSLSSGQMDQLTATKPKFPPPPEAFVPAAHKSIDTSQDVAAPGGGAGSGSTPGVASGAGATAAGHAASAGFAPVAEHEQIQPADPVKPEVPTRMGVDSVDTLPPVQTPPQTTGQAPVSTPPSGPTAPTPGVIPPVFGGGGVKPIGNPGGRPPLAGRSGTSPFANGRGSVTPSPQPATGATGRPNTGMPGQSATGRATGAAQGRLPANNGVSGGRPQPATGKPTKGIPRGTVMGGEGNAAGRGTTGSRGLTNQGPGSRPGQTAGRPGVSGESPRGAASERRAAGITGEKGGIVGGRPQQQGGRPNTRAFSTGGSGLVRGQGSVGGGSPEDTHRASQAGRNAAVPNGSSPVGRRDEARGVRPDYLTEDEQTWQPESSRNVPPVVDDAPRNNER